MKFRELLDTWKQEATTAETREYYSIKLSLDDAARIAALAELFPSTDVERIVTDLLSVAVNELEASIPYVPGNTVIREDDHGDPIYEDTGLTPRFLELVRKHRQSMENDG